MKKTCLTLIVILFFVSCSSIKIDTAQKRFLLDEKGKGKYFLIDFINKNKGQLGNVPTLIIYKKDGEEIIRSDKEFKGKLNLKRKDFTRIEVLSIEKSIPLYGASGKNGVLTISYYGKPNLE